MSTDDCKHENMVADEPHAMGNWTGQGLRCVACGFQTLRVETYTPLIKPCPKCGVAFDGMEDVPEELCDACDTINMDAWIRQVTK